MKLDLLKYVIILFKSLKLLERTPFFFKLVTISIYQINKSVHGLQWNHIYKALSISIVLYVYIESKTSTIETISFKKICLHQKHKSKMNFSLIFCTPFSTLSKHLEFLFFQVVHLLQAGTILHLLISFACKLVSSQLVRACLTSA